MRTGKSLRWRGRGLCCSVCVGTRTRAATLWRGYGAIKFGLKWPQTFWAGQVQEIRRIAARRTAHVKLAKPKGV